MSRRLTPILAILIATASLGLAAPVINEFLAGNRGGLTDSDGDTSDWIEIYNPTDAPIDLLGYGLSDDENREEVWTFPSRELGPKSFLLVFASGKDRLLGELHTDFRLDDTGYLSLTDPSGQTLSEFAPSYPEQVENVSYGVAQSGNRARTALVLSRAPGMAVVPTRDLGVSWRGLNFDDAAWSKVTTGIGYEAGTGYEALFGQNGDLRESMLNESASVFLRIPFQIDDLAGLSELILRMKYDDGFVAFINGVHVASENSPSALTWTSEATENHDDASALVFQTFDASAGVPHLRVGNNILAIHGLNVVASSSDMLIVPELDAVRVSDVQSGSVGYLERPSPGALNGSSFEGFVSDTKFSKDRGFYDAPIDVGISTSTEGAEIRYTTDGNAPTATSGMVYTSPVQIRGTTTLRAAAFKEGLVPTNVDTVTYLFVSDVVSQSSTGIPPVGWPRDSLNGQALDFGMDPEITQGVHQPAEVEAALRALPTLSITTNTENLFGAAEGIYVHAGNDGRAWERPASIELLNPDSSTGFQIDGGLRIRGGFSRSAANPKHSFRLFFRREYGDGKLRYPMFGDEGADSFDNLDLRTSQNYSWAFGGDSRNTMLRDVFSRDMQGRMGHAYTRSRYYHLYLNGHYWGLYQTQERAEASYAATYLDGAKEDFDVIKSFGAVTDGTRDAHSRLWAEATAGFASDERYWRVQGLNTNGTRNDNFERLLDVDNLIDYMILTYYTGDRDGPGSRFTQPTPNNFYAIYNRTNPDGFKYFEHDSEHSLGTGEADMTFPLTSGDQDSQFNPHWLHERLVANATYRQRFAELVYKRLFNGGLLTPQNAIEAIERRAKEIDQAIIAESARWGDAQRAVPYTRADWLSAVDELKRWVGSRRETVIAQLKARGWIPDISPPAFSVPPGPVAIGSELLFLSEGGTVFYTTDGSDPETSPTASTAQPAGEARELLLPASSAARAIVPTSASLGNSWYAMSFNDVSWQSGRLGVGYDNNTTYRDAINLDVNASMNGRNTSVYIRVPFTVSDPSRFTRLTLHMRYDDGFAAFLNGTRVASANSPGALAWNSQATAGHDDSEALQYQGFDLSDRLGLLHEGANVLAIQGMNDNLASSDLLISPQLEGGRSLGSTAVVLPSGRTTIRARTRLGTQWSPLSEGTFLVGGAAATSNNTVISEIMYHPAPPTESEAAAGYRDDDFEYIELLNIAAVPVDVSGLFFLKGITFRFAADTLLAPGSRTLLVSNRDAFAMRYGADLPIIGTFNGSLDNSGERLALVRAWDDGIRDFSYNDKGEWPLAADGTGRSLVLADPTANQDPSEPTNWLISTASLGAPGIPDEGMPDNGPEPSPYQAWKAVWNLTDDFGDPDRDGLENLLEYYFGSLPLERNVGHPLSISSGSEGRMILEHSTNPSAIDTRLWIETSDDLNEWNPTEAENEPIGEPNRRRHILNESGNHYVRLRVAISE